MYWIEVLLIDGTIIKKESNKLNEIYQTWNKYLTSVSKRNTISPEKITTGNEFKTTGEWTFSKEKKWIQTIFH